MFLLSFKGNEEQSMCKMVYFLKWYIIFMITQFVSTEPQIKYFDRTRDFRTLLNCEIILHIWVALSLANQSIYNLQTNS